MIDTENPPENEILCDMCGRQLNVHDVHYDYQTGQHLCHDCKEDDESCGCSDE